MFLVLLERVTPLVSRIPTVPERNFNISATCIVIPIVYLAYRQHRRSLRSTNTAPNPNQPLNPLAQQAASQVRNHNEKLRIRFILTILIVFHTFWMISVILVHPSRNIFRELKIPLNLPVKSIKTKLKESGKFDYLVHGDETAKPFEELVTRFSNFDIRLNYIRFGHSTLLACSSNATCTSQSDYALLSLSYLLPPYVLTTGLVALICCESNFRAKYKAWAVSALMLLFGLEMFVTNAMPFVVPEDGKGVVMIHDTACLLRNFIFLLLPPLTHYFLPSSPPTLNPLASLVPALTALQLDVNKFSTTMRVKESAMMNHTLRSRVMSHCQDRSSTTKAILADPKVQAEARRLNLHFVETDSDDPLPSGMIDIRTQAKNIAEKFKDDLRRVTRARESTN